MPPKHLDTRLVRFFANLSKSGGRAIDEGLKVFLMFCLVTCIILHLCMYVYIYIHKNNQGPPMSRIWIFPTLRECKNECTSGLL